MSDKETLFECGGCGCSFDTTNNAEKEILAKHDSGEYPCEKFDWFCDNYGSVENCQCESCLENAESD
jgi:hypothetical protein